MLPNVGPNRRLVPGMIKNWRQTILTHKRDVFIGFVLFLVAFATFYLSPVYWFSDSKYTLVVSQSLLSNRSFALDHFALPRLEPKLRDHYVWNGDIYQQEWVGGHLYYYLPPGSSILSVPFVGLMNVFGLSVINADGTYNMDREIKLQGMLAVFLMAGLASIFYFTSRLVLPTSWSIVVAVGSALGTQMWSTLSRALWADTWGIFLLGLVVLMLLADAAGKYRMRPIVLASLVGWTYFVRPTYAIPIVTISVYVLIFYRRLFVRYLATGLVWFALFIIYSWYHFGKMLPSYYQASRLTFGHFGEALAGNLISPARGLFIYIPVLLFISYLLARYRKKIAFPRLVSLSLTSIVIHWMAVSAFPHWWGGNSYGPRLLGGIVPWFVLLGILGIQAMLKARAELQRQNQSLKVWRTQNVFGGLLLLASIVMNGIGATMPATIIWSDKPARVDKQPSRLWDWRYPQFLAGFLSPPRPKAFSPGDVRIEFSRKSSEPYLWYGWSTNEEVFRWSDAHEAAVIFSLDEVTECQLRMKIQALLVPGKLDAQRANIRLNGRLIDSLTIGVPGPQEFTRTLPKEAVQPNNVLTFELPDAASPRSLNLNPDPRTLGIAVFWLEIQTPSTGSPRVDTQTKTVANTPLPVGGYGAELSPLNPPTTLKAGESVVLQVKVKNISGVIWPTSGQSDGTYLLRLGNHWLDRNGGLIMLDDGRTFLPYDLRPGREVELPLTITAPKTPGDYILELDMVQERVSWFADEEESRTARLKIVVR